MLCLTEQGQTRRYTNPRRWLPGFSPAPQDEAISTVITRYLYAYGPATPQQFAQWIGAPPVWAGEQFERHTRKLTKINFDGISTWVVGGDAEVPTETDVKGSVLLLPYFDSYVVGSHPRDRLFLERRQPCTRCIRPGRQLSILLVDGVVGGVCISVTAAST